MQPFPKILCIPSGYRDGFVKVPRSFTLSMTLRLFALAEKLTVLTTTVYSGKIENLRQTRDLLLPKLISGKVDVSELNIHIGES